MSQQINILSFGAVADGVTECTAQIQNALNEAAKIAGSEVVIPAGTFLSGALFLRSYTTLRLEKDAVLLGTNNEASYPIVSGRVAGVELDWPAALINIRDATTVNICGEGTIDGQGEFWWNKFWGVDKRGGMMAEYEKKNIRWAVDYDCFRVRNIIVLNSSNVCIQDICSRRSGFWNIHLCYSHDLVVRNVTVRDNFGPSTDGVDIDSCKDVLVEKCTIACNDDNICVKSGRDSDGLRVNRICENVTIRDNLILEGEGITLGSETSGGMRHIFVENNKMRGTQHGFRLKSAKNRGGVIEDVWVDGLEMVNVESAFDFDFNWFPLYSYCNIPDDYSGKIPEYWSVLAGEVPQEQGMPHAKDIHIKNVTSTFEASYAGKSVAFHLCGYPQAPFENLTFTNIDIKAKQMGSISNVNGLQFNNVNIACTE